MHEYWNQKFLLYIRPQEFFQFLLTDDAALGQQGAHECGQAAGGGGLILLSSSVPEAPLAAIPAPTACCVR